MEVYIPTTWLAWVAVGFGIAVLFFFVGRVVGVRCERRAWMAFIEDQCRLSMAHSKNDPIEAMLKEREAARQRRLQTRYKDGQ